ncbi:MAG: hypothetical protein ACXVAN_08295 [Polyangia bacterium]
MFLAPLLVSTLTLAPTGADSRFELVAGGAFDHNLITVPSSSEGANGFDGRAGIGLNLFVRRLRDDDAPPTLQPFLQRVGELHIDGGGGGFTVSQPSNSTLPDRVGHSGYFDLAAWGYAQRFLYGYAHFGVSYSSVTDTVPLGLAFPNSVTATTLALPVEIAGGVRAGDVRFTAGWSVTPTRVNDADFSVPFWGHVRINADAVVRRRLALDAEADLLDGGAGASGGATLYLARRFGLGALVRGSHEHPGNSLIRDHAGAGLSFEAWATPRVAVALSYSFDWWQYSDATRRFQTDYVNLIDLTFRARPR